MKQTLLALALIGLFGAAARAEIRVSTAEGLKNAVNKPQPAYSPVARQMKVAGKVEVEATVDESGNVENVKAVTGNPLLTQSAISAVQKWKFNPFTAEGKPTKAVVSLSFDFKP